MMHSENFVRVPSARLPGAPVDWTLDFDLPGRCPHCGKFHAPRAVAFNYMNLAANSQFCMVLLQCGECRGNFIACHHVDSVMAQCTFVGMYPNARAEIPVRQDIQELSPLFSGLYRQALACAAQGDIPQACVELRWAISLLIRDYATKALGKKAKKVERRSTNEAFKAYLPKLKLFKRAETARLLKASYPKAAHDFGEKEFRLLQANADMLQDEIGKALAKKIWKKQKKELDIGVSR